MISERSHEERVESMSERAPYQVLVLPFRRAAGSIEYGVVRRADLGCWQGFAGGGVVGEPPSQAARREAAEEGGLPASMLLYALQTRASVPRRHFAAAAHWPPEIFVVEEHSFAVDCTGLTITLSEEHTELRWGPYDTVHDLLRWDSNRTALWELDARIRDGLLDGCRLPEIDLSREPVSRELAVGAAAAALGIAVEEVEEVAESHSAVVRALHLRGGEQAVLKLPLSREKLERELAALRALRELPITPEVLGHVSTPGGLHGLLTRKLPGEPRPAERCSLEDSRQIGEALARIHDVPFPVKAGDGGWAEVHRRVGEHLEICRRLGDDPEWRRVEEALPSTLRLPPEEPVLTHFDFRLGNILFEGERLTGVVDFESSRPGAASLDFAKLADELWVRGSSYRDATLEGYVRVRPIPPRLEEELPLFRLTQALACVAWCVKREQREGSFYRRSREAVTRHLAALTGARP